MEDIHSEKYVKSLFDEMSETYGVMNILSSLGSATFWRRQAVYSLPEDSVVVGDFMAGGAECLFYMKKRFGHSSEIHLVDWSEKMCEKASSTIKRRKASGCEVMNASALNLPVQDHTYDAIVSTFGLKTLAPKELSLFAKEIKRTLKPSGRFSILEFSMPSNRFILFFFQLYVKFYVPLLGRVFLGNPGNYRMLWEYTKKFGNCRKLITLFEDEGFVVEFRSLFFGAATQIVGYCESDTLTNGDNLCD